MEERSPAIIAELTEIHRRAAEIAKSVNEIATKYSIYTIIDNKSYIKPEGLHAIMILALIGKDIPIPARAAKGTDPKKGDTPPTIRNRLFAILKFVEKDAKKARALFTALTGKEKSHEVADGVIESLVSALHRVKEGSAEVRMAGAYVWIHDKPTNSSLFGNRPPPPGPVEPPPVAPPVAPPPSAPPQQEPPAEMDPF
jgi:hypothetical protein